MRKRKELSIEGLSDSAFQQVVERLRGENESYERLARLFVELETAEGAERAPLVVSGALPEAA